VSCISIDVSNPARVVIIGGNSLACVIAFTETFSKLRCRLFDFGIQQLGRTHFVFVVLRQDVLADLVDDRIVIIDQRLTRVVEV
jgi:hypothetical protein